MKVGIVGSRKYKNLQAVRDFVGTLAKDTVVISGGAIGVDFVAAKAARARGLKVIEHQPRGAGVGALFARNTLIAQDCDLLVAFWDGASNGTMDTVHKAEKMGRQVSVIQEG